MNLDAYFFFEVERDDGFEFDFAGAILHIDECQASNAMIEQLRLAVSRPRDCFHPIKMPVTLVGCIGEK